jgi:signal transduction histidine kinase
MKADSTGRDDIIMAEPGAGTTRLDGETEIMGGWRVLTRSTMILGAGAVVIGILGIIGLVFNITVFRSISSGYQPMAFSTAALCIVLGTILIFHEIWQFEDMASIIVRIIVAGIAFFEAFELPLNIMGGHFFIEAQIIRMGALIAGKPVGASSPGTLFLVIVSAIGLFLLLGIPRSEKRRTPERDAVSITGMIVTLVSLTILLSYTYGAPFLYGTSLIPVAAPTALALTCLGAGMITAAGPASFPARYFTGRTTSARLLRTFVPLTLVVIFADSVLSHEISAATGTSETILVSASIVIFSVLTGYVVFGVSKRLGGDLELEEQERVRAETALATANKKLNILSSVTRHDILNQLTAIQSYLELYHQDCRGGKKEEEYFTRLMGISKTIGDQITFTGFYQELGVKAPVWQRVKDVALAASRSGGFGSTRFTIEDIYLEIFADPLLENVFFNLYDNSLRHGEHVTGIRVSVIYPAKDCIIVVEDNGIGVPAQDKERIFERGVGKHTGLGLFLAREILAITGMTIRENGEPGKGARFEILVPRDACRPEK